MSKCRKKKANQKNKQDAANPAVDQSNGIALTSFDIVGQEKSDNNCGTFKLDDEVKIHDDLFIIEDESDDKNEEMQNDFTLDGSPNFEKDNGVYIADSGASAHMTGSEKGMFDCRPVDETISIGNGKGIKVTKIGKKIRTMIEKDGLERQITLSEVKLVLELKPFNLFLIPQALDKGFQLSSEGKVMVLKKGNMQVLKRS